MYLSYYNLKAKPFQMSTDPAFLWLGEKHREALAVLKYAVLENKGVLALTGDVGTGKTTLINALLESLGKDTVTATIYDPRLEVLEFFNTVAAAFKIEGTFDGKGKFILKFMDFLMKTHERNQRILLIIDEAQGINEDLLEEIRLLSNLEAEYTRLLNIFFVGQNEFIDILQKYENRALRQRVTIRYHIDPLTLNETAAYIKYRLEVSGTTAPIFDSGAIDEVFFFSGGYPRLINIMCDHALLSGYVREVQVINANLIRECREELLVSKQTSENDFQYSGNNYRSLPNETMFSETPLPSESMLTEPSESSFIPVEDSHSYEDEQMVFSSWQPMSERTKPIKPLKKPFYRSPIIIALFLFIGIIAGYFFYSSDKYTSESFATLAQQRAKKYLSDKAGSNNDIPPMAPARPETSDIPSKVEAGNVGDSRFFIGKPPNSSLLKETIPKEAETPQVIPSKPVPEESGVQTYTKKPGGPQSDGNDKTTEANTAGDSNVSPESTLESESPKEIAPATTNPVDTVPSNLKQKVPVMVPITEKTPDKIQALPSQAVQVNAKAEAPETIITKAVEPVEKTETGKSVSKSGQAKEKTSEKYQDKPEVKQKKETESPKNTEMEKGPKVASSVSSEKRVTTLAAIPLVNPPKETVISSKKDLPGEDKIVSKEKAQPALSVQDEKKDVGRVEEKVVSLGAPASKSQTAGKAGFVHYNLHERLKAFLNEYCRTYEQKDLDKFSTFFALNAVEKGKPFRFWLSKYRQNFNRIDTMEYDIEFERYATQEETGLVKVDGIFHVRAKLNGSKEWRKNSGQISMVLEADGNSFKVRELDY
jgi:type II secretory pathway predicted ATPase ExeA